MKKLLILLFCAVFIGFFGLSSQAADFDGVYNNYQAVYSPSAKIWSTGSMAPDRIVLTKRNVSGSGSYSDYFYSNGKPAVSLGSNFEFIKDGRLIAVHNADLKFYEVLYVNGKFTEKILCEKELRQLFPKAEIVKISQFKNNKITIYKRPFAEMQVLLLNDTDKYFYKYSYSPVSVENTDIKSLINITKFGKITYSHYNSNNSEFPKYKLFVRPKFVK